MDTHKYKSSKRQRSTKESRKNKLTAHRRNPVCGTYCQGKDFFCCVLLSFLKQILQNKSAFFLYLKNNVYTEHGQHDLGVGCRGMGGLKNIHRTKKILPPNRPPGYASPILALLPSAQPLIDLPAVLVPLDDSSS